jgi:hypothetical protein
MTAQTSGIILSEWKTMLTNQDKACVTIILPLHRFIANGKMDQKHLQKAIHTAGEQLKVRYPEYEADFLESLNALSREIEFDFSMDGIGIFVSTDFKAYTYFPFNVTEKVVVGNNFDVTDVFYKQQLELPYYVLHLDEHHARLYYGCLRNLEEVVSEAFPLPYEDDYLYQPSTPGASFSGSAHTKSFEKDKHGLEKVRFEKFLHQVDEMIHDYFKTDEVMVLCGVKRHTSAFMNRTAHAAKIISVINGNYDWFSRADMGAMTWPHVHAFIHEKMLDEISDYEEKIGEGLAEEGMLPVWEAAVSGRGLTMLVEKDFAVKGYVDARDAYQLSLKPPKRKHRVLENAVNELAGIVGEKKGKVVFVENGMLRHHHQIALVTRY